MAAHTNTELSDAQALHPSSGISLKHHLLRLVGFAVVPIVLLTLVLLGYLVSIQRDSMRQAILEKARLASVAIDRELAAAAAIVNTIAESPLVDDGDFFRIYEFAQRSVVRRPNTRILMIDANGTQLFDTSQKFGVPLQNVFSDASGNSVPAQASWREVFRSAKPQYSDLVADTAATDMSSINRSNISYRMPILRFGRVQYVLAIIFAPSDLTNLLKLQQSEDRELIALVDRGGLIVARNVGAERYVGQPASASLLASMQLVADRGVNRGEALGGEEVLYAYRRSALTGWTVAVAAPVSLAYAPLRGSIAGWGTLVLGLIALAVWLARRTWKEVGTPLIALANNAGAFERGESVLLPNSRIREVQNCSRAWTIAIQAEKARRVQEQLRLVAEARRQESERVSHEKDRLLAALSHELRNPLGAIANSAYILERIAPDEERLKAPIAIIRRQSEHLCRLIEDMLDLARATFGKMPIERRPVDLMSIVRETVSAYDFGTDRQSRIEVSGLSAWVEGDATRLGQVLRNLLDNALKFSPQNGKIHIHVSTEGGEALLIVSDQGTGIPAAMIDRLFDAFVQNEQTLARTQGGLGLGLALVREIVEMHGGSVSVASPGENQGAAFTVRIKSCAQAPTVVSAAVRETSTNRCILIIEDQNDARISLQRLLEEMGHLVYSASDGLDGIERLSALMPDLALVDIGLPGLDGLALARRVRENQILSKVRLIALTGYSEAALRQEALSAGFAQVLLKPVRPEELQKVLAYKST